jgi:hypothetical protein
MSCEDIKNSIINNETNLGNAQVALAQAATALETCKKNVSYVGSFFTQCEEERAAVQAAEATIKQLVKTKKNLRIQFRDNACDQGQNCANGGKSLLGCVTLPDSVDCSNHKTLAKVCCELEERIEYLGNLFTAANNRKAQIDSCTASRLQQANSVLAAASGWKDGTDQQYEINNKIYGPFAKALEDAVSGAAEGKSEQIVGDSKKSVAFLRIDGSKIEEAMTRFNELATSPDTIVKVLGVTLPSVPASAGSTDPLPDFSQKIECSGNTTIPALNFNCYTDEEKQLIENYREGFTKTVRKALGAPASHFLFAKDSAGEGNKGKVDIEFTTGRPRETFDSSRRVGSKMDKLAGMFKRSADKAFAEIYSGYFTLYENSKARGLAILQTIYAIDQSKKKAENKLADLKTGLFSENQALIDIRTSVFNLIKNNLVENVTVNYKSCDGATDIISRFPKAEGEFAKTGWVEFDSTSGQAIISRSKLAQVTNPEQECCPATGKTGGSWSKPVVVTANLKIVLPDNAKKQARNMPGLKDLTKEAQDSILDGLDGCTGTTLTFCDGESS